jgi:hypothetical protein
MLLVAWLEPAGRPGIRPGAAIGGSAASGALRSAAVGLGVWALGIALPAGLLTLLTAAPHVALAHGFWLGTPALLNFSAPAAVLRASYRWIPGTPLPIDWEAGIRGSWVMAHDRQLLSVAVSLLTLTAGLLAIAWRLRRARQAASGDRDGRADSVASARDTVCALIALALLAAPISWYHYQLLQLPAFVLALTAAVRARRWGRAVLVVAAVLALTRHELWVLVLQALGSDSTTALYRTGFLVPLAAAVWFASRVLEIGGAKSGVRAPGVDAAVS